VRPEPRLPTGMIPHESPTLRSPAGCTMEAGDTTTEAATMDLPSIDLNLLVALHSLLTERSVTKAGETIGLSQPATSAALGKLRRHFGDELLAREGSGSY
jgi:hypothetical protein